ncbi:MULTISPECIES: hypothetical protein [unclassified Ruminococcus]|nr:MULTISPECIES: hypothetical protein [unclassified Ruminococcus]
MILMAAGLLFAAAVPFIMLRQLGKAIDNAYESQKGRLFGRR